MESGILSCGVANANKIIPCYYAACFGNEPVSIGGSSWKRDSLKAKHIGKILTRLETFTNLAIKTESLTNVHLLLVIYTTPSFLV